MVVVVVVVVVAVLLLLLLLARVLMLVMVAGVGHKRARCWQLLGSKLPHEKFCYG